LNTRLVNYLFHFYRALRNEHRNKLLLLTSEKSLEGKLFNSLPEMPLKTTRIFSTKALKLQTNKVFKNLNEVQAKKQAEVEKNLKKKNRLMTGIFNKNLQRNVLKGNLNLSNTVTLTTK
jgi:ALMS motif